MSDNGALVRMMQQYKPLLFVVAKCKVVNTPILSLYGIHPPSNGEMDLIPMSKEDVWLQLSVMTKSMPLGDMPATTQFWK